MRVLVTGGAGFIGSEVVHQLCREGHQVIVLDNESSGRKEYISSTSARFVAGDICDDRLSLRLLRRVDSVINLAAYPFIPDCYDSPEEFFRVNAMGSVQLMWNCVVTKEIARFVQISSSEVYGTSLCGEQAMDETHPTLPHSTYAASKLAADRAAHTMHKEHGLPAVILRPFNSYGPRVTQPYIVPEVISQLSVSDQVSLGNTTASRDFTFVSDTANAILRALTVEEAIGHTINIGSGKDISIGELVQLIAKIMGKKCTIRHDSSRLRPNDVVKLKCCYDKAKRILAWDPTVPLEAGLTETVSWMQQNRVAFKAPFRAPWPAA